MPCLSSLRVSDVLDACGICPYSFGGLLIA
jgi:hypothetical protein